MKRILSFVLVLVMIVGTLSVTAFAYGESNVRISQNVVKDTKNYVIGDANGDKAVNAIDANLMKGTVAQLDGFNADKNGADVDGDGKITSIDVFYEKALIVGNKKTSDFEGSNAVNTFKIAGTDLSQFTVVLPESTEYSDNIYFAYELLKAYAKVATGVDLPTSYGNAVSDHSIFFVNAYGTQLGDELGADGYKFYVENGNLYICGSLRGNMYAVYEILEKYMGFLFYDNSFTLSEKVRFVDLEEGLEEQFVPAIKYRGVYANYWGSTKEWHYYARKLNGSSNSVNSGDSYYGWFYGPKFLNAHSYWYYVPMGEGEMPEDDGVTSLADRYYQKFLNGGGLNYSDAKSPQPCATGDDVFETLYQGMLDVMGMLNARGYDFNFKDRQNSVSFSINDRNDYCQCRICKAIANGTDKPLSLRGSQITAVESLQTWYTGEMNYDAEKKTVEFHKEGYPALYMALANRAAERLKTDIPGARVVTIIYDCFLPETIKPGDNIILWYCGSISGCATHHFGEECNISTAVTGTDLARFHSDSDDATAIDEWVKLARESGAEVWYWYYPENYSFYLYDLPVIFDMYYDFQWLASHGVEGIYYEGSAQTFNCFERIKSSLASELMWNPYMSMDEYKALIKHYLKAEYGYGYEHVYNFLTELENAADAVTICVPYFCGAFDSFSKSYIAEHYEYMRNELALAVEEKGAVGFSGSGCGLDRLQMMCEVLGLSACYDSMYANGTEAQRNTYKERYDWLYSFIKNNNINCGVDPSFKLPDTKSYDESVLMQIYHMESRYKTKGYYSE